MTRLSSRWGGRGVLLVGFFFVIALLVFSTIRAYQIQGTLSDEALNIYHRHIQQDDLLFQTRRTLWQGANAGRDFLLDPGPNREVRFAERLGQLKAANLQRLGELERMSATGRESADFSELRSEARNFWSVLERLPAATAALTPAQRFEYVQREIVTRRNAVGDEIRELTQIMQSALRDSEAEFVSTRRVGAQRLLVLLGLSLLVAVLVAGLAFTHTARLEDQASLQYQEALRAKADLRRHSTRLMHLQEEERTRLSRELHDEIGQTLATLRLEIKRTGALPESRRSEVRERLDRACELTDRTIQVVRDTSRLLRPALLDDLGLSPALQWLAEDFTRRTHINCRFEEHGVLDTLPDAIRTCVYRIVQEALHNCEKHAAATNVSVRIRQAQQMLTVHVEDDGCGFKLDANNRFVPADHFGILGMHERALELGGTLDVESSIGKGTRLTLRIPYDSLALAAQEHRITAVQENV